MTKRSAETVAEHESLPEGVLPFFAPFAKRSRSRGGCDLPASPSDLLLLESHAFSTSSDEMCDVSDAGAFDQAGALPAHHLAAAPGYWAGSIMASQSHQQHLSTLGVLSLPVCPEARAFLDQLATCTSEARKAGSSAATANLPMAASIGTAMWHAFAELNVVMARHFPQLPTFMLRGYHSFTKSPRAQLWSKIAASQGSQLGEDPAFGPAGWPPHLLLIRFLLEHVLASYPAASCVLYTFELPPWLRGWCARWGHPFAHGLGHGPMLPPGAIRVMALFAYSTPASGFSAGGSAAVAPPRVMYLPCP